MLKDLLKENLQKTVEEYTVKPKKMEMNMESSSHEYYPYIDLKSSDLPEIKELEVGDTCVVIIKLEVKSKRMYTESKKEIYSANFDIKEIAYLNKEEESPKEETSEHNSLKKAYGLSE